MNIIFFVILCKIVFIEGVAIESKINASSLLISRLRNRRCNSRQLISSLHPPNQVKIGIISNGDVISHMELQQTQRVLANEHLPIWISNDVVPTGALFDETHFGLKRDHGVMKKLGKFTTYQDRSTSSAAIYFHARGEFDGMIDHEFFIKKLSINEVHSTEETLLLLNRSGVYRRSQHRGHADDHQTGTAKPDDGVNYQRHMTTYNGRVHDGFPEVLVIVSWDVSEEWIKHVNEAERYTTVVSHILTLFNGVDMLYSKLKQTNIQINLAGIIIEEEQSFLFMENCYYYETSKGKHEYRLNGECVNVVIRKFMYTRRNEIPVDSYDIVIFLTSEELFANVGEMSMSTTSEAALGISSMIKELYSFRQQDLDAILVATITTTDYVENYPTIAHEMAHLMTVNHDVTPFFTYDGECCGNLLKTGGGWCKKCLSWSETSENAFKSFFGSPNCCTFINKPRSLHPPGRHVMLTADEQCQCYGYQSAIKFSNILRGFCQNTLQCEGQQGGFHRTVIPMDGTPCRENEVCWQRRCKKIVVSK